MLTWHQKKLIIYLSGAIGSIGCEKFWSPLNPSKAFMQQTKNVIKELEKLSAMIDVIDDDFEGLTQDIKKGIYKFEVFHEAELEERKKRIRKTPVTFKKEDIDDLLEYVAEDCKGCTRNFKRCPLRKIYKRLNVAEFDPEREHSNCPYYIKLR